jgi:hypothetical protein
MADLSSVQQLLSDFVAAQGGKLDGTIDPMGAEIETDGRKLRILPSDNEQVVVIEVDVCQLSDWQLDSADLLMALHRLNDEARFIHAWAAIIDDTDAVVVSAALPLSLVNAENLPDWLSEGLDRAESLAQVLSALGEEGAGGSSAPQVRIDQAAPIIRG